MSSITIEFLYAYPIVNKEYFTYAFSKEALPILALTSIVCFGLKYKYQDVTYHIKIISEKPKNVIYFIFLTFLGTICKN